MVETTGHEPSAFKTENVMISRHELKRNILPCKVHFHWDSGKKETTLNGNSEIHKRTEATKAKCPREVYTAGIPFCAGALVLVYLGTEMIFNNKIILQ